jgi:hypothetical protein
MARMTTKAIRLDPDVAEHLDAVVPAASRRQTGYANTVLREHFKGTHMPHDFSTQGAKPDKHLTSTSHPKGPVPAVKPHLTTPSIGKPHPLQVGERKPKEQ